MIFDRTDIFYATQIMADMIWTIWYNWFAIWITIFQKVAVTDILYEQDDL